MVVGSISTIKWERAPIDEAGRLVLPIAFRRALGITGAQSLMVGLDGDRVVVRTLEAAVEQAQEVARRRSKGRKPSGSVVDQLIADRRAEAKP
ncbi:MAG: AbrB/MazE/SpoVT family DNA-binding domain-containing protein [Acidobacteria bacterium]|nr:AbrB/MazE/SpoVT family DNA-binding domain-containing protein [Acidobacteriota bacterium]MYD69237.1 AbrB/MazE/SpoVT family DNA-binding domain-containing protein [Acidobacteriota bacterium]MYJ05424.1 AbrB/MazE/SpoVT family DNA-binding domain-containing protein [Acidobacteriota bacterium]